MTGNVVVGRYAKALFTIGSKEGLSTAEAYGQSLADLAELLKKIPSLAEVFHNPLFTTQEKQALVERLLKEMGASKQVTDFCLLLALKGRLDMLLAIESSYRSLLDEVKGVLRGKMITAVELDSGKCQEVVDSLQKRFGRTVILDFEVDPSILGGVVLKVGDKILDASLRAQLGLLRQNITRGE